MTASGHLKLLVRALAVWLLFWFAGLPDYYQQYTWLFMAILCTLLSVAVSLVAVFILLRSRPEERMSRGFWISIYFTVPLAILDWFYCGIYLGHGAAFLLRYWYATLFYFVPWLIFAPTAFLLKQTGYGRRRTA